MRNQHPNGNIIYLSENTSEIVDNESLSESIAKRLNVMYDGTPTDPIGFKIFLEDYEINTNENNKAKNLIRKEEKKIV